MSWADYRMRWAGSRLRRATYRTKGLPALVRTLHLYASLFASFAIAFFALTGLVGELRGPDADTEAPRLVAPTAMLTNHATLADWLRPRMAVATVPRLEDAGDALIAQADDGADLVEAIVALPAGTVTVTRWHQLPSGAPLDRAGLALWFARSLGGTPETGVDPDDMQAPRVQLVVASVWWTRSVTVDRIHQRWSERCDRRALGSALAELHTGKYASWGQRRLMDAAAISLLFSTLTGLAMGITWVSQRRRRLAMATLVGGCAWVFLLVINR